MTMFMEGSGHCADASGMLQGLKGVIRDRKGVGAVAQAVQVPGGIWVRGATICVFTDCGVLALEASSPAAFMLWCAAALFCPE